MSRQDYAATYVDLFVAPYTSDKAVRERALSTLLLLLELVETQAQAEVVRDMLAGRPS